MATFIVTKKAFVFPSATEITPTDATPVIQRCTRFEGGLSAVAHDLVDKTDAPAGVVKKLSVAPVPDSLELIATEGGRTAFCRTVTDAAAEMKADRNYLVSLAYFQSDRLAKFGKPADARIGPFAYDSTEWCAAFDGAVAAGQDIRIEHLFEPAWQATMAAIRAGKAMADFTASEKRPPIPVELFFFERLGMDGLKLLKLDPARPCSEAFSTPPAAGSYGAEIAAKTSGDVIKAVKDGLTDGFVASRADVERLPPHLRFYSDEDAAPWLAVARLMAGDNLEHQPTKLAGLFKAVVNGMGANDRRSAAFVAFCLTQCGVKEAKDKALTLGDTAGLPESWKGWAAAAPDPLPAGSIVITKPEGGTSSVGILAATPTDDNCQVWFCSDEGLISVGRKTIARSAIDVLRCFDVSGAGDPTDPSLGNLSKKFESGAGGPGTVSTGKGDAGGVSYGTYQFASKTGSAAEFVASLPADLKARFAGLTPGEPNFSAVWVAIAAENAERFGKLQHDHIKTQFYDALVAKVKTATAFDANTRSSALQNCCWSTAVQHGASGGASIVARVLQTLLGGGPPKPDDGKAFDEAVLQGVYAERGRRNADGTLVFFGSNSRDVQESVANRFKIELADALKMLG